MGWISRGDIGPSGYTNGTENADLPPGECSALVVPCSGYPSACYAVTISAVLYTIQPLLCIAD